jgi:hypothetical protein
MADGLCKVIELYIIRKLLERWEPSASEDPELAYLKCVQPDYRSVSQIPTRV